MYYLCLIFILTTDLKMYTDISILIYVPNFNFPIILLLNTYPISTLHSLLRFVLGN